MPLTLKCRGALYVYPLKKRLSFDNILIVGMKFWAKANSYKMRLNMDLDFGEGVFHACGWNFLYSKAAIDFSILKAIWIQSIVSYWFSAKAIQSLCSMNKILCKGGLFKFCTTESGYCISPTFFWLKKWNKFVPEWMRSGGQNWTHTHNKYKTVTTLT